MNQPSPSQAQSGKEKLGTLLLAEPCKTGCADSWTHEYVDLYDANGNYLGLMRKETAALIVGIVNQWGAVQGHCDVALRHIKAALAAGGEKNL